jgi:signal peptidase I
MAPICCGGDQIEVVSGGVECAEPLSRGEILVLRTASNKLPLIKGLRGMPGDTLAVQDGKIIINGAAATNSEGVPYQLPKRKAAMIELYAHDYKGVIPPDSYLVMGEIPSGSTDSSQFGLIGRDVIIGKALTPK